MKFRILETLKQAKPEYVSGEEISISLNVSRTAIWKQINSLREDGYVIDSQPRSGYRLTSVPDKLYPQEIQSGLNTDVLGNGVIHFEQVTSTNDIGKEIADQGAAEGTVIVAEEQTGGRGRLGRKWLSPKGSGIWMTTIFRPAINPQDAPKFTLLAALAVARALRTMSGLKVTIKWPNDIVYDGKKLAGILTEMSGELDRVRYIIVGIGINVNVGSTEFSDDLQFIATSVKMETGQVLSRVQLVQNILVELEQIYIQFMAGNFQHLIKQWKELCSTFGKPVKVSGLYQTVEGMALDISTDGALLIRTADGNIKAVTAGDVLPM